jgi:tetratricopeptide (TPR) repeat protein
MRLLSMLLACALAAAAVLPARAGDPFEDPLVLEIHALHEKAAKGDEDATEDLVEKLEKEMVENPKNALLKAYLGSAYTLASRDAFYGPNKLKLLKKGLQTMDAAVESDPENCPARFIRAVNNFELPTFVNRRDNARADFARLLKHLNDAEKNGGSLELSAVTQQAIYYYAGLCQIQLKQTADAKSAFEKAYGLDANSDLAEKIAVELNKLKS